VQYRARPSSLIFIGASKSKLDKNMARLRRHIFVEKLNITQSPQAQFA